MDKMLEIKEVSFADFEELEEIVTPGGSGSGCNCASAY